jgi:hypothetical protein
MRIVNVYDSKMNFPDQFCHRTVINSSMLHTKQRQANFKERASSYFAFHADITTMGLDNPLHNG